MIVAHLGPGLARTGGPAGYLWQLRDALAGRETRHRILFPEGAPPAAQTQAPSILDRLRRRVMRTLTGAPRFYRPPVEALRTRGGDIDRMLRTSYAETAAAAEPSVSRAMAERADVLFAHDAATAAAALDRRARGQQVWLMLHSPMSTALYLAWSWGVPEEDWRTVLSYPDVAAWTQHEVEVCTRVDRVILPCPEAAGDLARCDSRFARVLASADIVPTGASRPAAFTASRSMLRARLRLPIDQPVGLFLGSLQSYRGCDALLGGLSLLADPIAIPGTIAVAGPDASAVPVHERVRALGRVEDVGALLHAVDFVVNVNRFSLFDLSLVESLEASRAVLLHNSGGNRAFVRLGAGCVTLANLEPATIADGLERCFSIGQGELDRLGRKSRVCYEAHLTPAHMASRHLALYDAAASARGQRRGPKARKKA